MSDVLINVLLIAKVTLCLCIINGLIAVNGYAYFIWLVIYVLSIMYENQQVTIFAIYYSQSNDEHFYVCRLFTR